MLLLEQVSTRWRQRTAGPRRSSQAACPGSELGSRHDAGEHAWCVGAEATASTQHPVPSGLGLFSGHLGLSAPSCLLSGRGHRCVPSALRVDGQPGSGAARGGGGLVGFGRLRVSLRFRKPWVPPREGAESHPASAVQRP